MLVMALLALAATGANAQDKAEKKNDNQPVFSVVKENKITSIKNQSRSGTCWDYSTLSYFEAEILRSTGKTYDLCESFVANKTYMDRAVQVVRLHATASLRRAEACMTRSTACNTTAFAPKRPCRCPALCTATHSTTTMNSSPHDAIRAGCGQE